LDEKSCHSYEFNASTVDSPGQGIYSPSLELHYMSTTAKDNVQIVGNEDNRIKMLEKAIEEEKAAYAALYLELEKEIAAAATAADDAMAMILRLQEEKASMEMEMRQYERLIEERAAYDEEEMDIMQEILIRREKENLFLEKELESYRPTLSFQTCDDTSQTESVVSNVKKDCANADHGEEVEENSQRKGRACNDMHRSFYDTESDVLDVHVIDDNIELTSCPGANSKCKSLPQF